MSRILVCSRHYWPVKLTRLSFQVSKVVGARHSSGGSSYEDYTSTSSTYDGYRRPIGLDIITNALTANASLRGKHSPSEFLLLDAGCGSGNYLKALVPQVVSSGIGLEFNEGMIAQAEEKFKGGYGGESRVDIFQGSITALPFENEAFDAVLTTQVLHHLVKSPELSDRTVDMDFEAVALAASEVSRCLKPGGVWVISTQTPEQHEQGFWWAPVVPNAAKALAQHFPSMNLLKDMLKKAGFSSFSTVVPPEPLVDLALYLDIEGPFSQEFRNADSTWSLATETELEQGLAKLRAKIDDGSAQAWLREREAIRAEVGQTTTVVAIKPLK